MNPIDAAVGSRLRARRQQLGLTSGDVGAVLGRFPAYVEKLESGEERLLPAPMFALCRAFDVPVSFFYEACPIAANDA